MPPPDIEAIAEQVFAALADPSRRAILAALASGGPATATDLAGRLPITRQAIAKHLALLADAGLVTAEPGERRRVRYRLRSAPMQVAQPFLAALARPHGAPAAGVVVIAAGAYELTPIKRHFRRRCREAPASGLRFGLACAGSSIGLMAMLVALDVMSLFWMSVVAILTCAQKL